MYELVNLDVLSELLDINLKCPSELFDMGFYSRKAKCGTTHCLVGNYAEYYKQRCTIDVLDRIKRKFGITGLEYDFLFVGAHMKNRSAIYLSQKEALTRLAKFIIYKRRKKELWEDYEKARKTEGNNFFCNITQEELDCVLI